MFQRIAHPQRAKRLLPLLSFCEVGIVIQLVAHKDHELTEVLIADTIPIVVDAVSAEVMVTRVGYLLSPRFDHL